MSIYEGLPCCPVGFLALYALGPLGSWLGYAARKEKTAATTTTTTTTKVNPKRAGLFGYLKSGGGGGGGGGGGFRRPPPSDLGRGAAKNSEIWHVRRVSRYERADKIAILKIKAFF